MYQLSNNIITVNRGDNFSFLVSVNLGTLADPDYYTLTANDKVYMGVMEPNQPFEEADVKKVVGIESYGSSSKAVQFDFASADTEYLLPGTYYYEVKLYIPTLYESGEESGELESYEVHTLMSKKKFIILD